MHTYTARICSWLCWAGLHSSMFFQFSTPTAPPQPPLTGSIRQSCLMRSGACCSSLDATAVPYECPTRQQLLMAFLLRMDTSTSVTSSTVGTHSTQRCEMWGSSRASRGRPAGTNNPPCSSLLRQHFKQPYRDHVGIKPALVDASTTDRCFVQLPRWWAGTCASTSSCASCCNWGWFHLKKAFQLKLPNC